MQLIKCTCSSLALLALATGHAAATDVCVVQKSADGFVALRAAPSADAPLLARAKTGEAVVIQKSANGDLLVSGRWVRVIHYPDTVVPQPSDPTFKLARTGWMHRRYVNDCG